MIVRALGMKESVKVDTRFEAPRPETRCFSAPTASPARSATRTALASWWAPPDLTQAAANLINKANENGGPDNVTCISRTLVVGGSKLEGRSFDLREPRGPFVVGKV